MSDPLRISSQAIFYTKFIPCFHIEKDMLTVTNLSLETQIKNGDYFITGDDCLELIMSPIINKKHTNYEDNRRMNYDNMVIKYSEFPGMKNPDLAKRKDVFIRIEAKTSFCFNWKFPRQYPFGNYCIRMSYSEVNCGSVINDIALTNSIVIPTLTFNLKGPGYNFEDCNFMLLHSTGGYYCNLNTQDVVYEDFMKSNNFTQIVTDQSLLNTLLGNGAQ